MYANHTIYQNSKEAWSFNINLVQVLGSLEQMMRTIELLNMWLNSDSLPGPTKAGKNTSAGEAEMCPHWHTSQQL